MLSCLTSQYEIPLRNLVVAEEIVQSKSEAALKSSRRRHASTERYITIECCIETFNVNTQCLHFLADTIDVACPRSTRTLRIIHLEFYTVFQVDRVEHYCICAVRTNLCHNTLIYCTWEYESTIVVGVLTDKVDAAWRHINITCFTIKVLDEAASYFFDIHNSYSLDC